MGTLKAEGGMGHVLKICKEPTFFHPEGKEASCHIRILGMDVHSSERRESEMKREDPIIKYLLSEKGSTFQCCAGCI